MFISLSSFQGICYIHFPIYFPLNPQVFSLSSEKREMLMKISLPISIYKENISGVSGVSGALFQKYKK